MTSELKAYYAGRNSIEDNGATLPGFREVIPSALLSHFFQGQRDMRAELRLSADTEWDSDEDCANELVRPNGQFGVGS